MASAGRGDASDVFPGRAFREIAGAGLLAAPLAPELGGAGLGLGAGGTWPLLRVLEALGRGDLSVGRLYEGHVNALLLIQQFGSPSQIARMAADVRGDRLFGVWNSDGSPPARFEPVGQSGGRLIGTKDYASGAGHVERPVVTGTTPEGGRLMVVVPMERVTVRVDPDAWMPLGMGASASYRVEFLGAEVSAEDVLGGPGDYLREPGFSGGAIRFVAVQVGGIKAVAAAAIDALRALGRGEDPAQLARIGEIAVAVEAADLWLRGAAAWVDSSGATPEAVVHHVHMARIAVESLGLSVLQLATRSVGLRGLIRPHPLERLVRDLTTYLRQPGPDAALAAVGRRALLTLAGAGP